MIFRRKGWRAGVTAGAAAAVALAVVIAGAQTEPTEPPASGADAFPSPTTKKKGKKEQKQEPVEARAAHVRYDGEEQAWYLVGNVVMTQPFTREENDEKVRGQRIMLADEALYNEEDNWARVVGHLQLKEPDATITGEQLEVFFDDEYMIVKGNVRVEARHRLNPELVLATTKLAKAQGEEVKALAASAPEAEKTPAKPGETAEAKETKRERETPEETGEEEFKTKLTILTCDKLTYHYEEERAIAEGAAQPKAVQYDPTDPEGEIRTAFADKVLPRPRTASST